MNRTAIRVAIRGERPEETGLGQEKIGNVKFFIDKAGRILYAPHFICSGPTLRG